MKLSRLLVACLVMFVSACTHLQKPSDNLTTRTIIGNQVVLDQVEELEEDGVLKKVVVAESFPLEITVTGSINAVNCLSKHGRWLNKYQECEFVSEQSCNEMGGQFNECASACRHQSPDVVCIQMCVPVCTVN